MSIPEIHIAHLWPELLNANGSQGNLLCLRRRLEWRGYSVQVEEVPLGSAPDWDAADLVYIGGGTIPGRSALWAEIERLKAALGSFVAGGGTVLAVCEGFELLGRSIKTVDGTEKAGFGIGGYVTEYKENRLTGPVIFDFGGQKAAAFENHAGRVRLDSADEAAGKMLQGCGNDEGSGLAGWHRGRVFGFPFCGPLLPRNAFLADEVLAAVLERYPEEGGLAPLEDGLEEAAREILVKRWEK